MTSMTNGNIMRENVQRMLESEHLNQHCAEDEIVCLVSIILVTGNVNVNDAMA